MPFPFVLKPRFGSWGRDVFLCRDDRSYRRALAIVSTRSWFTATGAVVQTLIQPRGHDLRILVGAGEVIGAIKRVARRREWRTNVALGAQRVPVEPPPAACELALAAAPAIGGDLIGVDVMPGGPGRYTVLELNGAVDFSPEYDARGDVYGTAMAHLAREARKRTSFLPEITEAFSW